MAKGYTEPVTDHEPFWPALLFCTPRALFYNGVGVQLVTLCRRCECCISTCSSNLIQFGNETPPHEVYNEENRHVVRRLNKAIYGLRSARKQWQDHIAHILTVAVELVRCATESNVYRSKGCLVYVEDLLLIGVQKIINTLFSRIQQEVLLRHTGDPNVGSIIDFLGNIARKCNYIDISFNNNYVDTILEDSGMTTCSPAPSPQVLHMKGAAEELDHEQLAQWLARTRPDICSRAKERARSLQAPTQLTTRSSSARPGTLKAQGASDTTCDQRYKHRTSEFHSTLTHTQMPTGHHVRQQRKSATGLVL